MYFLILYAIYNCEDILDYTESTQDVNYVKIIHELANILDEKEFLERIYPVYFENRKILVT